MNTVPPVKTASPMLGSTLSDDLKDYIAPTWWRMNRDRVWAFVFFVLLFVSCIVPEPTTQQKPPSYAEVEAKARMYASTLTACANGHTISVGPKLIYCDPHTAR
jgi:hypothetical protein